MDLTLPWQEPDGSLTIAAGAARAAPSDSERPPGIRGSMAGMERSTIVLVEDDDGLRDSLTAALEAAGHHVQPLADGLDLDRHLPGADLVILDLDLPVGPHGLSLATRLRRVSDVPIVILTAAGELEQIGAGYRAGADQYIAKPFSTTELLWRIDALLRRAGTQRRPQLRVGELSLDISAHEAHLGGQLLELTRVEFALLTELARHAGQVLGKTQLLDLVWGHTGHDPNLVETNVARLRRKLERHGRHPIETVRGVGYRLTA